MSKSSLNIRIEDEIYKSESGSSDFSVHSTRSCENNSNKRKLSASRTSLNLPHNGNHANPFKRQISSSPVKSDIGSNCNRRVSQDSGVVSNRGYISSYNVSALHFISSASNYAVLFKLVFIKYSYHTVHCG